MTLAACGVLHPVVAALLMVVSSLSLIFSATRVGVMSGLTARTMHQTSRERQRPEESPSSGRLGMLPARRAIWHGLAFALQGVVFLLLLDSARELPVAAARSRRVRARRGRARVPLASLGDDPARARHVLRHAHARQPRHAPRLVGRQRVRGAPRRRVLPLRRGDARGRDAAVDVGRDARVRERRDAVAWPAPVCRGAAITPSRCSPAGTSAWCSACSRAVVRVHSSAQTP